MDKWAQAGAFNFSGFQLFVEGETLKEGDSIELYPPEPVSFGDGTLFDSLNPCTGGYYNGHFEFGWGEKPSSLFQETPEGYWMLLHNNNKIAELDFGSVKPLKDGKIAILHPIIRVNTASDSDKVESIEVKWYGLDENGEYFELQPETLAKQMSSNWGVEISNFSADVRVIIDLSTEDFGKPVTGFSEEWHVNDTNPASGYYTEYIGVSFRINAMGVRFAIREDLE
ncbi:MAG: hypothetical protein DRP87_07640 [Spirochaetes bacterium]|nr:MAG: hypothetical protein DRP87_07640 [Spirochaetota bacterium]